MIKALPLPAFARILALALAPLLVLGHTQPLDAQSLRVRDIVRAEILPGWQTDRGTRMIALRLQMARGWHTYWRIPGDSGIAPRFDWSRSQNLASVQVHWPRPEVFEDGGMVSYGFEDELILPIEITPRSPNRPVAMIGEVSIGVCDTTCVPADLSVMQPLRGRGERDPRITRALALRPEPGASVGLTRVTCRLAPTDHGTELTMQAQFPRLGRGERTVIELPGHWVSGMTTSRSGGTLTATARVRAPGNGPVLLDRSAVQFSVLAGDRMVSVRGCRGA